jgi:HlyD family secretion protein
MNLFYREYNETKREYERYLSKSEFLKIQYAANRTKIISPFNGIIYEKLVEEEEVVSKNTPVFKIADLKRYRIEVKVGEYDLKKCKKAKTVILKSELNPKEVYQAKIKNISIIPDKEGYFTICIELLDKKDISYGTSYMVEFLGKSTKPVLAVSISAVFKIKDRDIVYMIKNEKIKIKHVQPGISDEEYIEIKKGLSKGDEVVMISYEELNEGDRIMRLKKWK